MTAGAFLKKCREKAGFSQDMMAQLMNRSQSDISKLEKDRKGIDLFTFRDWTMLTNAVEAGIAFMYNVDAASLFQTAMQVVGVS